MKTVPLISIISLFILLTSCDEKEENYRIEEPTGSAHYYVTNRSAYDLVISYTTSVELGTTTDNSKSVARNTSVKILDDAIFGMDPKPTNSLSNIQLYINNDIETILVFMLDPIVDDHWEITEQELHTSGYSKTKYELIISNEDLDIQ